MEEFSFPNLWFIVPQTIPQQYLWLSSHQLAPSWPIICRQYRGPTLTNYSFLYTYTSSRECEEVHQRAKKNAPRGRVYMVLVAPQGFEPRSSESESLVLPLNERAIQVFYRQLQARREPQSAALLSVRAMGLGVKVEVCKSSSFAELRRIDSVQQGPYSSRRTSSGL
jgi:hypothetical protein